MSHIAGFMKEGKSLLFSLPNMEVMLQRKYTNCINFEHTVFLTEDYVEFLLAQHGFRLVNKEYFLDDHSIFYHAVKDKSVKPKALSSGLYDKNKKLYRDYVSYHEELIKSLNGQMQNLPNPIYLFGAHVFSQYLIAFGLNCDKIVCLLDNDANKQGKRLYGTELKVASPKILREVKNPAIILKAGVYNQEIREDILNNINPSTIFLE